MADNVSIQLDLQAIPFADASFDAIYCSHVLEHVWDDRAALRELRRILRPSGWAIIQVPVGDRDQTFEDPSIESSVERERLFGQADHVRVYGRDAGARFRAIGLEVNELAYARAFSEEDATRLGFIRSNVLFVCRKLVDE